MPWGLTPATLAELLPWGLARLLGWTLVVAAAAGAGHAVLRKRPFHSRIERWAFSIALGFGAVGWALMVLGWVHLLRPFTLTLLTALAVFALWLRRGSPAPARPPDRPVVWVSAAAGCAVVLAGAVFALYPPRMWDSTMYHLVLAREYLRAGALVPDVGLVWPVLPPLNQLLFAWAMALDGDLLAQLVEYTLMLLVAAGILSWGLRRGEPGVGLLAATAWLTQPPVLSLGTSAYVDVGLTCFAFFCVLALRLSREAEDPAETTAWWHAGMLFLGIAAATKTQAMFLVPTALGFGLWSRFRRRLSGRTLVVGGALGVAAAAPAYLFIARHAGNPLWPGLSFGSDPAWRAAAQEVWGTWSGVGVGKSVTNFLMLPVLLIRDPQPFLPDNNIPLAPWIAALPLAWVWSAFDRSIRWWTAWATAFLCFWFMTSQQQRFLLPLLPLVAVALAESLARLMERLKVQRVWSQRVLAALAVVLLFEEASDLGRVFPAEPPPTSSVARENFLLRNYGGYSSMHELNKLASPSDVVYSINASWLNYYSEPRVIDVVGVLQQPKPVFRWPDDREWVRSVQTQSVDWILMQHGVDWYGYQTWGRDPRSDPFWPGFELVYESPTAWIFRLPSEE